MIRLGSLAGYPFDGPRLLGGWTPPTVAAVYAIMYKPEPDKKPENYAVIYVGHADDLSAERFPFKHPRAARWIQRAGSKWKVYICTYEVPGGTRSHREQIARELIAIYRAAGIAMAPTTPATEYRKDDYRGALVLVPPSATGTSWLRRVGPYSGGFCSGWMRLRGERRRRGYQRGFVMSDHADWPALVATCRETQAHRVLTMHGYADALARFLTEQGIEARPLEGASNPRPPSDASLQ